MIFVNAVCPGSLLVAKNFSLTGLRAFSNDMCEWGRSSSLLVARNFNLTGFRACSNDICKCGMSRFPACCKELQFNWFPGLLEWYLWMRYFVCDAVGRIRHLFCQHVSFRQPEKCLHLLQVFLDALFEGARIPFSVVLSLVVFLYGISSPFFPFPSITFFSEWLGRTPSFFSLCYFCIGQTGENNFLPWSLYHVSGGSFGSGSSAVSFPFVWYGRVTFSGLGDVLCCSFVWIGFVYLTWV